MAFPSVAQAVSALTNRSCVALLWDFTWIQSQLAKNLQWKDYVMPFESEQPETCAIAVRRKDLDGPFGNRMCEIVTDWCRSGHLIERNSANSIVDKLFL